MVLGRLVTLMAIVSLAHAVESRDMDGPGYISFPLTGRTHLDLVSEHAKRQGSVPATERLSGTFYTVDITLGTPGQTVPVLFDTGSAELWVNPTCTDSINPEFCDEQPRFTQSDTLNVLDLAGHANYKSGWAKFRYVEDSVGIGSVQVSSQIFGAAHESTDHTVGVLGAGPPRNGWVSERPSLFDNLVSQGHIQSRSFGMNLRGFQTDPGAIIFGGLDTGKFSGGLQKLPVVPAESAPDQETRWWVSLDAISVRNGDGSTTAVLDATSGEDHVALLDSGYTIGTLPSKPFSELLAAFPEAKKRSDGFYRVNCLPEGEGGSVSFTFASVTIEVPYYDWVFHTPAADDYCILGAYEDDFTVLGDTFLRAAYVVYDFDRQTVHIAQADDCGSNIVAIGAKGVSLVEGDCGKD